jgi:hypothetical protein
MTKDLHMRDPRRDRTATLSETDRGVTRYNQVETGEVTLEQANGVGLRQTTGNDGLSVSEDPAFDIRDVFVRQGAGADVAYVPTAYNPEHDDRWPPPADTPTRLPRRYLTLNGGTSSTNGQPDVDRLVLDVDARGRVSGSFTNLGNGSFRYRNAQGNLDLVFSEYERVLFQPGFDGAATSEHIDLSQLSRLPVGTSRSARSLLVDQESATPPQRRT